VKQKPNLEQIFKLIPEIRQRAQNNEHWGKKPRGKRTKK
jgi:hypothetical protein